MANPSSIMELSDADFEEEVLGSETPVLVEFWSPLAYACRELDGVLADLAERYAGKVRIGRLDVEVHWETAEDLGVVRTPAAWVFQNGEVVHRIDGVDDRDAYEQAIHEVIAAYWVI